MISTSLKEEVFGLRTSREYEELIDPRLSLLRKRLKNIKRIVAVVSGKGGVGKTLVATVLSLVLVKRGYKVGLLDLDFHGPSCHAVLGLSKPILIEDKGVLPIELNGLKFMSLYIFAGNSHLPLRGKDVSNLMAELLAITLWGNLDYLMIDMPPGTGDELLELIKLIPRVEALIITTPSILSLITVKRLISLLKTQKVTILGIVENMSFNDDTVRNFAKELGITYLGNVPFDLKVEACLGKPKELLKTKFANYIRKLVNKLISP